MRFEWPVNDVATLRTKLEKAEREVREHVQHAFAASSETCVGATGGARCEQ